MLPLSPTPRVAPRHALRLLVLAAMALGTGCRNVSPAGVHFSSEPPGATILVDGQDSGWVTPCEVDLDVEREHEVDLALEGFATRRFLLVPDEQRSFVSWNQGVNGLRTRQRAPFLIPAVDLVLPFREVRALAPGRIFVRLHPAEP